MRCQVSGFLFVNKVTELVGGGSFINGAYPVYFHVTSDSQFSIYVHIRVFALRNNYTNAISARLIYQHGADSVSLVQCFSTLCCLYLIKIVFRNFWGGILLGSNISF